MPLETTIDRTTMRAAPKEDAREIDNDKVDEITLALLYLTTFKNKHGLRAWEGHDWDVLNRLHESGYIYDPATKDAGLVLDGSGSLLGTTIVGGVDNRGAVFKLRP